MLLVFNTSSTQCLSIKSIVLVLLMSACAAHSDEPPPPCILEIPVYSPLGDRLPFKVTRLSIKDGDGKIDLLGKKTDGMAITSKGDRVFFSYDRIVGASRIEITLEGPDGARITSEMIVTACRLRRSLFFGQSELGIDVSSVSIRGRLSGCQFGGDWWIRAMPMFGGHFGAALEDGYVEVDGSFWLRVGAVGVRRLVVVGKGNQPVRVIGVDITVGKENYLGTVDLTGLCPP